MHIKKFERKDLKNVGNRLKVNFAQELKAVNTLMTNDNSYNIAKERKKERKKEEKEKKEKKRKKERKDLI